MQRRKRTHWKCSLGWLVAAGLVSGTAPARAAPISFTVIVQSVTVFAGDTGDSLDITLTNTGTSDVALSGFSFGLSVAGTDIQFTQANTSTTLATYLFNGDSAFGPEIDVAPPTLPGQSLKANDLAFSGSDTITAGETLGLGHVLFDVSALAVGPYAVTLTAYPTTSLTDSTFTDIASDLVTFNDGTITVDTGAPEPSTFLLMSGVVLAAGCRRLSRGRR